MASSKTSSRRFVPDERQREAIEHVHGPMLVVAGAGTGKTSVLIHRIARLVKDKHARPNEIIALTYTVAAAKQMKERVCALVGEEIHAATFHDYCLDLLKRAGKDFGVLDEKDLWIYLRRRIRELRLEHYVRAANVPQFLTDLLNFLSRCHDELVTPEQYEQYVAQLERREIAVPRVAKSKEQLKEEEVIARCREIARVFASTERWLREENLGTFGHMITGAQKLLAGDERVAAEARARAKFVLVDEFQDANFAQIKILAELGGAEGNVFAVGDPDQAIYRFRGASSAAFHVFRRHFPQSKLVVLGKNRRSTTAILQCAFAAVDKNPPVFGANDGMFSYRRTALQSAREEEARTEGQALTPAPVEAVRYGGKDQEANDVATVIEETQRRTRCRWKDFGVLYRLHSHRDEMVQELSERGIPFAIENMDVLDTPEVRDLFACVAAMVDETADPSLFRVAALPQFEVDPEQLRGALRGIAKESREGVARPLASVLDQVAGGSAVLECVRRTREELQRRKAKTRAALEFVAKEFRLEQKSPAVQAAIQFSGDWENKPTTKTKELPEWIEYLELLREAGGTINLPIHDEEDAVRLMTVHGAKGLEFAHVFVLRAASGSFPSSYKETLVEFPSELRDEDSAAGGDDKTFHDQEERRLFYVAMTRARDSLHLYGKQGLGKEKSPAGWIRELVQNCQIAPWLRSRQALPQQAELIAIAAAAEGEPASGSRLPAWLALPPMDGLASRLSASAIESYETCPLKFKLQREWRLSQQVHGAMQYGAAMHRVLRTYYDSVRAQRTKTEAELLQMFHEDLTAARIQDEYQRDLYLALGAGQLKTFLAAAQQGPAPEVLNTEEWFEVDVAGTKVAGRIDRIDRNADGSVAIVDYKTGKARSQEDADESLQLSIYAMAAKEKWGYRVGSLVFHNLDGNVPVLSKRDDFQVERARERVKDVARHIAEGNFEPKPGFHCNYCAFRSLCPAKEKHAPKAAVNGKQK